VVPDDPYGEAADAANALMHGEIVAEWRIQLMAGVLLEVLEKLEKLGEHERN
jgi:hypothetical protein